jgi:predicted metal-dependent hydrolase
MGEVEELLARAASEFNDARYHEAHEILDELWERGEARDADFFKGLIQACIAMHHYAQGNLDGARKLYSGHRQYLGAFLPQHRGLDVARFLGEMQSALAGVVRARPGSAPRFEFAKRPRLDFRIGA